MALSGPLKLEALVEGKFQIPPGLWESILQAEKAGPEAIRELAANMAQSGELDPFWRIEGQARCELAQGENEKASQTILQQLEHPWAEELAKLNNRLLEPISPTGRPWPEALEQELRLVSQIAYSIPTLIESRSLLSVEEHSALQSKWMYIGIFAEMLDRYRLLDDARVPGLMEAMRASGPVRIGFTMATKIALLAKTGDCDEQNVAELVTWRNKFWASWPHFLPLLLQ